MMVRWHPLPSGLPEPVADFKRALRRAIDDASFRNLAQLAQRCGVPTSTISDAASSRDVMPSGETLVRILTACGKPELKDERYGGSWKQLHKAASETLNRASHPQLPEVNQHTDASQLAQVRPSAHFIRTRVTPEWTETTEMFVFSDEVAFRLARHHLRLDDEDHGLEHSDD